MVTDKQREALAKKLAVVLAAIYLRHYNQAQRELKQAETGLSKAAKEKIAAFVAERSAKVQSGVNYRLENPPEDDNGNPQTQQQIADGARDHNAAVLAPFLLRWAAGNAQVDAYPDDQLFTWEQNSDCQDSCSRAAAASPDTAGNLISIAGGIAGSVHENCGCDMFPA